TVMQEQLSRRGLDFATEFTRNHLWHFASGSRAAAGYGFPDAAQFPDAAAEPVHVIADSTWRLPDLSRPRAAQYLLAGDMSLQFGELILGVEADAGPAGAGLLAYNNNGTVTEVIHTGQEDAGPVFSRVPTGIQAQSTWQLGVV